VTERDLYLHIRNADAVIQSDEDELLLEGDMGVVLRFTPDDGPLWSHAHARAADLLLARWRRDNPMRSLADTMRLSAELLIADYGLPQYNASLDHARRLDLEWQQALARIAGRLSAA